MKSTPLVTGKSAALLLAVCAAISSTVDRTALAATVRVAAKDSSAASKAAADFVADGTGDQEQVMAAIRALPEAGGTVLLLEGTYDIRRVDGTLGGVTIDRSRVVLAGQGAATVLRLAAEQNTNVVRIIGSGVGDITIRDLTVDANRDQNAAGTGDPNISHDRFEFCGIKAFRQAPRGPTAPVDTHDVTVRNCAVKNVHRLNIMLEGPNMRVLDNVLGNAGSDSVEILTGPGIIRGNYVRITGRTHVAIGSDRGNSIIMVGNIVDVRKNGDLDIGFRSWADSQRHVISNNILTVAPDARCGLAMDVRGNGAAVTGNTIQGADSGKRIGLKVEGTGTIISGNFLQHVEICVPATSVKRTPVVIGQNVMENSTMVHIEDTSPP